MEIVLLVARCNRSEDRSPLLPEFCGHVEEFKILVSLVREVSAFQSFRQFAQVMEQMVALARQAESWRRSLSRQATRPEPRRSHAVCAVRMG